MKNQITSLIALTLLLLSTSVGAQYDEDILQALRVDVIYLASDDLEGREAGQKGERLAAQYIATRFAEIGLQAKGTNGQWVQPFPFKELVNPHTNPDKVPQASEAMNVIAFLDHGSEHTIIIGGHYDHLGYGGSGSRAGGEKAIHNGADDNASGVAALLQLAEQLKNNPKAKQNNYLFITFSAEEKGLFGSKYFVENPTIDLTKVSYMLNMDMVGRLNAEKVLVINGVGTSPKWKPALESIEFGGIQAKTS
ncbi:MAG: M20/M25/M40 family metallo-hydrolase, partial [Bacteroidota bacterium]